MRECWEKLYEGCNWVGAAWGWVELHEGWVELHEGWEKPHEGWVELCKSWAKLNEGWAELCEGQAELLNFEHCMQCTTTELQVHVGMRSPAAVTTSLL